MSGVTNQKIHISKTHFTSHDFLNKGLKAPAPGSAQPWRYQIRAKLSEQYQFPGQSAVVRQTVMEIRNTAT